MLEKNNGKKKIMLSGGILLIMIIILLIFSRPMNKETGFHEPDYQISFLVRGTMNNAWGNMKKGADMAANDLNAAINFIPIGHGTIDTPTQQQTIAEELKNKTQAIILSPNGSIKHEDLNFRTPLIFAESRIGIDKKVPYIGCNKQKIGVSLADEIIRHGNFHSRILIFVEKEANDSKGRTLKSLEDVLRKEGNKVSIQYLDKVDKQSVYASLVLNPVDVVVALGEQQLEEVANASRKLKKEGKKGVEVYGIGNSKEIIAGIEDDSIISTIIQDDYSIGYLSVRCAVDTIKGKRCEPNEDLRYAIIDKENMYKKENEWLLFPFVR